MKQWKRMAARGGAGGRGGMRATGRQGDPPRGRSDLPAARIQAARRRADGFRDRHHERLVRGTACALRVGRVEFRRMIPGLLARKFDVIASSMTITPKRQQQIAFTNRISNAPARLVARKPPLLPTADALKGKRVGVEQEFRAGRLRSRELAAGRCAGRVVPEPGSGLCRSRDGPARRGVPGIDRGERRLPEEAAGQGFSRSSAPRSTT